MKNKHKILIATPLYPPQVGGPASRTVLLERELPGRNFDVSVVKFGSVLKFPKVLRHLMYFCMVLFKGIGKDVILAQDPVSTGFPTLLASKILRKKLVLIIVGDYAWEQGSQRAGVTDLLDKFSTENDKYPLLVRTLKKVQFFVANKSDRIVVPSFYLKGIVSNWGIPEEKISVVYNSFEPPVFEESKEAIRKELKMSGKVIVSAGRLVPWKGFEKLISEVMPAVLQKFPDSSLVIIGDGPDKGHLESVIKESGLKDKVALLGRKPQHELFRYIRGADVFTLNTAYEGMSHQLLEVMALGTPIVTTNIGGNLEVISDGQNGILANYNDSNTIAKSILNLLEDSGLSEQLVSNGKEKIKDFSEEKMISDLINVLK